MITDYLPVIVILICTGLGLAGITARANWSAIASMVIVSNIWAAALWVDNRYDRSIEPVREILLEENAND